MANGNDKKPVKFNERFTKIQRARMLDKFAEHLSDECSPSEAAFRAGAKRSEGSELLDILRRKIGLPQTR